MPTAVKARTATNSGQYAAGLGRAFAGAAIFSLPLMMTMEMWWIGFYLEPWRVIQFSLAHMFLLYGLSKVAGFEESHNWADDVLDGFAAYFVAAVTSASALWLLGVLRPAMTAQEIAGIIAIQAVPASFGAMIGAKLMGEGDRIEQQEHWRRTYSGRLFLMLAGALFLSFTVAPTEEMILIAFQMDPQHALLLILLSLLTLHAIVYMVGFYGQKGRSTGGHFGALLRNSLPGYAIAVVASAYVLWSFGRLDGLGLVPAAMTIVVLAVPASVGAAVARIVI